MNWISVEDRLPENEDDVLAVHEDAGGIVIAWWYPDKQIWMNDTLNQGETLLITHWMPLPEPPLKTT